MHECGQVLLVFESRALKKVKIKEERLVERERKDESAQVWT